MTSSPSPAPSRRYRAPVPECNTNTTQRPEATATTTLRLRGDSATTTTLPTEAAEARHRHARAPRRHARTLDDPSLRCRRPPRAQRRHATTGPLCAYLPALHPQRQHGLGGGKAAPNDDDAQRVVVRSHGEEDCRPIVPRHPQQARRPRRGTTDRAAVQTASTMLRPAWLPLQWWAGQRRAPPPSHRGCRSPSGLAGSARPRRLVESLCAHRAARPCSSNFSGRPNPKAHGGSATSCSPHARALAGPTGSSRCSPRSHCSSAESRPQARSERVVTCVDESDTALAGVGRIRCNPASARRRLATVHRSDSRHCANAARTGRSSVWTVRQ